MNYYNEFDPNAASWLRELIRVGVLPQGVVDERSILEVNADELKQYTQCHFFAGIGGWSYALRLAGWADDRPCWTGSPPCQPFSNAGKQKAQADTRHLWPVFFNLIRECKPANIFGEQVEAAIRTGWLDDLQDDLETEGYATGKIVLPACGVGGYHIRQRIWFVAERLADTNDTRPQRRAGMQCAEQQPVGAGSLVDGLADSDSEQDNATDPRGLHAESCSEGRDGRLADTRLQRQEERQEQTAGGKQCSEISGLADTGGKRRGGREGVPDWGDHVGADARRQQGHDGSQRGDEAGVQRAPATDALDSFWGTADWLWCRDEKWRPVEPGLEPLVDGLPERVGCGSSAGVFKIEATPIGRVMRLRGYGNAIVPPLAAEFIKAYTGVTNV